MEFLKVTTLLQIINEIPKIKKRVYYLAGGTDLMVLLKDEMIPEESVIVDISDLKELCYIKNYSNSVAIGSLTTFTQIIKSFITRIYSPLLVEAARTIGSVQIRNRATIGGNIANASPAGDSIPALFVQDAEVITLSNNKYKITEFFTDVKKTVLKNGELIKEIRIPKLKSKPRCFFFKSGPRQALSIAKASLAMIVKLKNKKIEDVRIAAGAVGKTVIRATNTESFLLNNKITEALINESKIILKKETSPITDFRSTDEYRREVTSYFLEKALRSCM